MGENKYQKGKIYLVTDVGYNKFYYGSTCEVLSTRMSRHRKQYKLFLQGKNSRVSVYEIFDEFGLDNCKIELVEMFPSGCLEELRKREGYYIKNNQCVNKHIAGQSTKEYQAENKEQILQQRRQHYQENREQHLEKVKIYQSEHREDILAKKSLKVECECGAIICKGDKAKHERTKRHLSIVNCTK